MTVNDWFFTFLGAGLPAPIAMALATMTYTMIETAKKLSN